MKQVASLSANLLARKGTARPAAPKGLDLYGNSAWGIRKALEDDNREAIDHTAKPEKRPATNVWRPKKSTLPIEQTASYESEAKGEPLTHTIDTHPVKMVEKAVEERFGHRHAKTKPIAKKRQPGERVSTTVRLTQPQHRALKVLATLADRSMQSVMTEALEHYFQTEGARAMMALFPVDSKQEGGEQ